jgi:hypothetical protein
MQQCGLSFGPNGVQGFQYQTYTFVEYNVSSLISVRVEVLLYFEANSTNLSHNTSAQI